MNKKLIIAIVAVVIVLAVGVGAYAMSNKNDDKASTTETTSSNTNQAKKDETTAQTASIADVLGTTDTKQCSFNTTIAGRQTSGTIYFSNKRLFMTYSASKDGKTTSGSMIVTNGSQYVWDNGSKKGVKFSFSSDQAAQEASNQAEGVDVNQKYNFSCKAWTVDESKFTPPSDVTIQDLSQLQQLGQ